MQREAVIETESDRGEAAAETLLKAVGLNPKSVRKGTRNVHRKKTSDANRDHARGVRGEEQQGSARDTSTVGQAHGAWGDMMDGRRQHAEKRLTGRATRVRSGATTCNMTR